MKLLAPKELNTKLQDQKKTEIEAGMFLAKKVDKLREDVAEAERIYHETVDLLKFQQESFRDSSVKEKERILNEIRIAEDRLFTLRVPLDDEWTKVKEESEKNSTLSFQIIEKEFQLSNWEKQLSSRDEELKRDQESMEYVRQETKKNFLKSIEEKEDARLVLSDIRRKEKESEKSIQVRSKNMKKREDTVSYRELDNENKRKNLIEKERELAIRERRLTIKEHAHN